MRLLLFILICSWWVTAVRAMDQISSSQKKQSTSDRKLGFGLSMEVLVPNDLTDFQRTVPAMGPIATIPLGKDDIEIHIAYGSAQKISLFLSEVGYRYNVITPFIHPYFVGGIGYLHYGYAHNDHNFLTPLTGLGFWFSMTRNFQMNLAMKIYIPEKTILNFGGTFVYLL